MKSAFWDSAGVIVIYITFILYVFKKEDLQILKIMNIKEFANYIIYKDSPAGIVKLPEHNVNEIYNGDSNLELLIS